MEVSEHQQQACGIEEGACRIDGLSRDGTQGRMPPETGIDVIGVLSHPTGGASGDTPLSNLIGILSDRARRIYVITGDEGFEMLSGNPLVRPLRIGWKPSPHLMLILLRYLGAQLRAAYQVARVGLRTPVWLFFIDGQNQVVPMMIAKLLRRRVVLIFAFSAVDTLKRRSPVLASCARLLQGLTCSMADGIVVYSPRIVEEYGLQRWKGRITVGGHHRIDFGVFSPTVPFEQRPLTVGFIGRMTEEKGCLEFARAIPGILERMPDVRFVMIGGGALQPEIEAFLSDLGVGDSVRMPGWTPREELPELMNQMRLIVIPSFTEGLPNVMLEAMACGTVVAATPVGAVPDLLREGETGYLLCDNQPETIASVVTTALMDPELAQVASRAHAMVVDRFSFPAASKRLWHAVVAGCPAPLERRDPTPVAEITAVRPGRL